MGHTCSALSVIGSKSGVRLGSLPLLCIRVPAIVDRSMSVWVGVHAGTSVLSIVLSLWCTRCQVRLLA